MDDIPIKLCICKYNNITNLRQEVLIISKRNICKHYKLKCGLIKLCYRPKDISGISNKTVKARP
jgi:hypothetical protein